MDKRNGFKCDIKAKNELAGIIEDRWFKKFAIVYDEMNKNDKAKMDITFTATSHNNNEYWYSIELKERDYSHNSFDDWFLEMDKFNSMMEMQKKGYSTNYYNRFRDNIYAVWNYDKCKEALEEGKVGKKWLPKTTMGDDELVLKDVIYLNFNNASLTGYTSE